MSLPVLLDTKYLLLSYTIWEYAVITVLWCTTELMFPFICRYVPVVGLVPLGYKYRALGCRTYLYTSTSLVSGRRYNMIVGCFYMSISMIWYEYCLMCPDSRRGRLHGCLAMLRGLPHPPAQPQCLFWLLPFSHQISPPPLSHQHLHFGFSLSGVPYFKVHTMWCCHAGWVLRVVVRPLQSASAWPGLDHRVYIRMMRQLRHAGKKTAQPCSFILHTYTSHCTVWKDIRLAHTVA